jgi:hypothetical protein
MAAEKGNNYGGNALIAKKALEHSMLKYQGEEPKGERVSKFNALVEIWDKQIEKAIDGDNNSAAMIIDRLDGKPKQQTEVTGKDDGPIMMQEIVFNPVGSDDQD